MPITCPEKTIGPLLDGFQQAQIAWSLDSRYIAAWTAAVVRLYDLYTGDERLWVHSSVGIDGLGWFPDSQRIVYNVNGDVYSVTVENNTPNPFIEDLGFIEGLILITPPFHPGAVYAITPAGHDLHLRASPSLSAAVLRQLQPGDTVTILEGPLEADGYTWWKMVTSDGLEGWAVEVAVWYEPVSTATPTPTPTP